MVLKRKSKKGFTLVELVVTIAILGIVSGMGVGIVANTIKNYAVASTTAKEQETAMQIEHFITKYARTASDIDVLDTASIPTSNVNAEYVSTATESHSSPAKNLVYLTTNHVEATATGSNDVQSSQSFYGVKKMTFRMRKQKDDPDDSLNKCQACLDYTIEMAEYYTLKGTVVMNNVREDTPIGVGGNTFTEARSEIEIDFESGTETKVLMFKR